MEGIIYIGQTREAQRLDPNVFKIGRTAQSMEKREKGYSKGFKTLFTVAITDQLKAESKLLKKFKKSFKNRLDYGKEYFEGSLPSMVRLTTKYLFKKNLINNDTSIETKNDTDPYLSYFKKDKNNFITITQIYQNYIKWCKYNDTTPIDRLKLKEQIILLFGKVERQSNGNRGWYLSK